MKKPKIKTNCTKPTTPVPFQAVFDASVDIISGKSLSASAKKQGISPGILADRITRIEEVSNSNLQTMSLERKIISEALTTRLKPLKEELSLKSLDIIRKADSIILSRLTSDSDEMKTSDVLKASEVHAGRFARITGIEEDPDGGVDAGDRTKFINHVTQNIFNIHKEKLEDQRTKVNDITPTPVYENEEKA